MSIFLSQRTTRALGLLLVAAVTLTTTSAYAGDQDQSGTAQPANLRATTKTGGKLTPRLEQLAQPDMQTRSAEAQAAALDLPERGAGSLLRDSDGAILVYIRLASVDQQNLATLRAIGAEVVHVAPTYNTVTAYVQPEQLQAVAGVDAVQNVREEFVPIVHGSSNTERRTADGISLLPPSLPVAQAGCSTAKTSEGDGQLKATQARATYGVNGAGVTVGVLSDSFGRTSSPKSVQQDIASGDLPGPANPCNRLTATNVISETSAADATDEGRAMVQIVHDLAPEARLAFATANEGLFQFADNIRNLRSKAHADVIVDDITYFAEPFYQDGPITLAIDDVVREGAVYFTSAGNSNEFDGNGNAIGSYEANAYRPIACPTLGLSAQNKPRDCQNFKPGGSDANSSYTLGPNGVLQFIFQWAEPWYGVNTDFDIFLTDASGKILAGSNDVNSGTNGSQLPLEVFGYQNRTGANQTVFLVIGRYSGTGTPRLKTVLIGAGSVLATEYNSTKNATDTFGPTIFGHSAAANALSIAAVPYNDATTPENFTSRGPATIIFGPTSGTTAAAAFSTPVVRNKPDVAATDGGRTTFFGDLINGVYRFYGTSAAAPHAAAVAALMKQRALQTDKVFSQSVAERLLESSAATIPKGAQSITGAGLVNALAGVAAVDALPQAQRIVLPLVSFGKPLGNG